MMKNLALTTDLSRGLIARNRGAALREKLANLTDQLATGRHHDLARNLRGNVAPLGAVSGRLAALTAYGSTQNLMAFRLESASLALENIRNILGDAHSTIGALLNSSEVSFEAALQGSERKLGQIITAFNSTSAGGALFSGEKENTTPFSDASTLTAELLSLIPPGADAPTVQTTIDDWFLDPTGFDATIYHGGDIRTRGTFVDDGLEISIPITGKDDGPKSLIKGLAVLTLLEKDSLLLSSSEERDLAKAATEIIQSGLDNLLADAAQIGALQATLEKVEASHSSERVNLETNYLSLVSSDPYETAAALEETQFQLESLYILTARTSRLSLTEYLR